MLKGGDYLIAVKGNQPTLHKLAQSKLADQPPAYTSEIECSHGRIEMRQLFRVELDEDISSFPQGRQLLGITRHYTTKTEDWVFKRLKDRLKVKKRVEVFRW